MVQAHGVCSPVSGLNPIQVYQTVQEEGSILTIKINS